MNGRTRTVYADTRASAVVVVHVIDADDGSKEEGASTGGWLMLQCVVNNELYGLGIRYRKVRLFCSVADEVKLPSSSYCQYGYDFEVPNHHEDSSLSPIAPPHIPPSTHIGLGNARP